MEQWKAVIGYEGFYEVSDRGRVRSVARIVKSSFRNGGVRHRPSIILKQKKRKNGYHSLTLSINGSVRDLLVHRLVAEAFCPREKDGVQVNHINGNKSDNRAKNLEWCTATENQQHAIATGLRPPQKNRKKIMCVETQTIFDGSYAAATWVNETKFACSKDVPCISRHIRGCATGQSRTAYGFHWKDVV